MLIFFRDLGSYPFLVSAALAAALAVSRAVAMSRCLGFMVGLLSGWAQPRTRPPSPSRRGDYNFVMGNPGPSR